MAGGHEGEGGEGRGGGVQLHVLTNSNDLTFAMKKEWSDKISKSCILKSSQVQSPNE